MVATFSRMLSEVIASTTDERIGSILDFYALQLLSGGGFDGRD